jgi:hypothetical protein
VARAQISLFIAGSKDAIITGLIGAKHITEFDRVLPNLRQKLIIEGAGHWIQQERADEVNAALIAFLNGNADERGVSAEFNKARGRRALRSVRAD